MTIAALYSLEDLNDKAFVTDLVRLLQFPQFILSRYFPDENVGDIAYRWNNNPLYQEPAVTYRAWDAETPIGNRPGVTRSSAELPPLGKKKIMTEEQYLRIQAMNTSLWGPFVQAAFDDLTNLTEGVHARWEIDRAKLLTSGQLTVTGPDVGGSTPAWSQTINYNVPSGNIVTAATLWSDLANSDPLGDITQWTLDYQILNRGLLPGELLAPRPVINNMLRNTALLKAVYWGNPQLAPTVAALDAVNATLQARTLPRIVPIDVQATDQYGSFGFIMAQNKVVLLPDPASGLYVGRTVRGITAEALGMVEQGTYTTLVDGAGIVAQSWDEDDPAQRYNRVSAVGMPVLSNPNLLKIATVA